MKVVSYKKPSESKAIKTEVVCITDTNAIGILQIGRSVEWMDIAAAVCVQTHAGKTCVTASINQVDFNAGAKVGDIILYISVPKLQGRLELLWKYLCMLLRGKYWKEKII